MFIRYGFEIDIELWQRTTLITAMDVHASQRHKIVWESEFETSPIRSSETILDADGNLRRRIVAEPGRLRLRLAGLVEDAGEPTRSTRWPRPSPSRTCRTTFFLF